MYSPIPRPVWEWDCGKVLISAHCEYGDVHSNQVFHDFAHVGQLFGVLFYHLEVSRCLGHLALCVCVCVCVWYGSTALDTAN